HLVKLALLQIELVNDSADWTGAAGILREFGDEEHACLACEQADVVARRDRQGEDALADVVEIDRDFGRLLFGSRFIARLGIGGRFIFLFAALISSLVSALGVIFLIIRHLLLIAFRSERRGEVLS